MGCVRETLKAKMGLNLVWQTEKMPYPRLCFRRIKSGVVADWITARGEGVAGGC